MIDVTIEVRYSIWVLKIKTRTIADGGTFQTITVNDQDGDYIQDGAGNPKPFYTLDKAIRSADRAKRNLDLKAGEVPASDLGEYS